jgi:hypothetical protein
MWRKLRYYLDIFLERLRTTRKSSVRIVDIEAWSRSEHLAKVRSFKTGGILPFCMASTFSKI